MLSWFKKLFGVAEPAPVVEPKVEQPEPVAKPKTQAKKPATKPKAKKANADLAAMTKKDLLALAKEKGIKANASLSKAELIKRLG